MASVLLSTNRKSIYFYMGIVGILVPVSWYFLKFSDPNVINNLHQQTFQLNYAAFKSGIRLAHYHFLAKDDLAKKNGVTKSSTGENLIKQSIGLLHFNQHGFPIAIKRYSADQQTPLSVQDCIDIWDSVLGPLKPNLSITPTDTEYWVRLSSNNQCIIGSHTANNSQISYDAIVGKVTLATLTD
ncbi:hypothetical protein [Aliikangiella maris]|uniref:Uncharacterized protein n=2 Tax=Aliikangiella maris TaxID=3162458 RepID=A0ABV3MQG8_9GAMM